MSLEGHSRIEQRQSGDYMAVVACRCGATSARIRPTPGEAAHALVDSGNSMEPALCDDCVHLLELFDDGSAA